MYTISQRLCISDIAQLAGAVEYNEYFYPLDMS